MVKGTLWVDISKGQRGTEESVALWVGIVNGGNQYHRGKTRVIWKLFCLLVCSNIYVAYVIEFVFKLHLFLWMWSNILLLLNSEMTDRHPQFPLPESFWDYKHRARLIAEEGRVSVDYCLYVFYWFREYVLAVGTNIFVLLLCFTAIVPAQDPHAWPPDVGRRYAPFIRRAGFLPLARLITGGLSMMDPIALTALMDRWRPETHVFHLPCGKTMVTLQGIAIILGLPINCTTVCGSVSSVGWRDFIGEAIVIWPLDIPTYQKDKKTTNVHSRWLTTHFDTCLEGAEDAVIQRYNWSCLWHMDDK
jgi:hypothetical protein